MPKAKVFIPIDWITGEMDLFVVKDPIEHRMGNLIITKARLEQLRVCIEKGYEVVHDSSEIDDDTICLVLDMESLRDSNNPVAASDKLEKRIAQVAGENYHFPYSVSITEYLNHPFFPAVFKNTLRNGGVDKFLISSPSQLEKVKMFFMMTNRDPKYYMDWRHVIVQQLIESPTKYPSYMRVLVSATGEVLGSSLKYAHNMPSSFTLDGLFERAFLCPDSPFYIQSTKMFNYYAGGENISLEKPLALREDQKDILRAHGMDPDDLKVPDEVLDVCQKIMANCNREVGVICGIDFMLNKWDGKWYYLENQSFPAIDEWATAKGIKLPEDHSILGYTELLNLETKLRLEVLDRCIEKRKREEKKQ